MIIKAKKLVEDLMKNENSGHGMEHINRVLELALKFAEQETCNKDIVTLGVLLHDVDDYKLFGAQNQAELTNTKIILNQLDIDDATKNEVLNIVANIGYSKRLKGKTPQSIEGKIVSDADMCDAIGAIGILRIQQYTLKHGNSFFDKDIWPIENINAQTYTKQCAETSVCHIFEKALKLKNLMLTKAGKKEAQKRHNFVVEFLRQFFEEENVPNWQQYLTDYLANLD